MVSMVSETGYQHMKLGISSEDLEDLIATRLDLMKKVCTTVKAQEMKIGNWG
jgi:hypothetical protein